MNPIIKPLQDILSNEFGGTSWRKYTKEKLITMIDDKVASYGVDILTERHYTIFRKRLVECGTHLAVFNILADEIFGQ